MQNRAVIRASALRGRAVVDLDRAEKLGTIDRIVVDPDARRVAGFLVSRGKSVSGEGMHMTVPASSVHAIGPDALTVLRPAAIADDAMRRIDNLPKASDLIGLKVVSEDGRLLGRVDDILINREDGRIVGYTLGGQDILNKLEGLFHAGTKDHPPYLRADAELRTGEELIVAPEGAVTEDWEADDTGAAEVPCAWSPVEHTRPGLDPSAVAPGSTIRRIE
jgi:sporulation protein YlmC with PRC-barrel domain